MRFSKLLLTLAPLSGIAFPEAANAAETAQFPADQAGAAPATPAASAAPAAAPVEPVASEAQVSPASNAEWQRDYTRARAELIAGHFELAAQLFRGLAASARDPADSRLANEQAALASEWNNRHLVLTLKDSALASAPSVADRGRRSTDEISILYTNAAIYGIGSGLALAVLTEPDSPGGVILPTLGIAGAALGAVALVDLEPHRLRYGVPQSLVSGMYIGLQEGITWAIWNQARSRYDEEWKGETVSSLIWASATVGAAVGGVVGSVRGTTPGRASYVGSTALWAGTVAGLTAGALGPEEDDTTDDYALLASAIFVNAGALTGMLTAGSVSPSIARVRFLDLGAVGGGLVLGGLFWAAAGNDVEARQLMGSTALGIAGGLGAAWYLTKGMAPDLGPESEQQASVVQSLRPTFAPAPGGGMLALQGSL